MTATLRFQRASAERLSWGVPRGKARANTMESGSHPLIEEALLHLEQAVRMSPGNARYSALLGEAYLARGDAESALAPLHSSFLATSHPRTGYLLALVLVQLNRAQEALAFASLAVEEAPAFHRAWAARAECREIIGRLEEAISDMREACGLFPECDRYRLKLGGLLLRHAAAASDSVHRALALEARNRLLAAPDDQLHREWHYYMGIALLQTGDASGARRHLLETDYPSLDEVAFHLTVAALELGDFDDAEKRLEQASRAPSDTTPRIAALRDAVRARAPFLDHRRDLRAPKTEFLTTRWIAEGLVETEELGRTQ